MSSGERHPRKPTEQPGHPGDQEDLAPGQDGDDPENAEEERDRPQDAWSARRDLHAHAPEAMKLGDGARFGGSLVTGDQHGMSGGYLTGDLVMGSKTEVWNFGPAAPHSSGEIPVPTLRRIAASFVTDEDAFTVLAEHLRTERVLVLQGPPFTGRRTAALMLLSRAGATTVRSLLRDRSPDDLATRLDAEHTRVGGQSGPPATPVGYVLCDLITDRHRPLREPHLLAVGDWLRRHNGYLVVTVGPTAALEDVRPMVWRPPRVAQVVAAHLRALLTGPDAEAETARLLALDAVTGFLSRDHQLREAAAFATALARVARGEAEEESLAEFSLGSLENQVREWFEEDEDALTLRDKAFLISLATLDGGPYALTAELSDRLYAALLHTQWGRGQPEVPVFGTHIGKRLQLARAEQREARQSTEWGPVRQRVASFRDDRTPPVLLREVWTGHPSARPAMTSWLSGLTDDGRPLVRTRAAATAAILAHADLPSAMALLIEEWAASSLYRHRLVAANALAIAHFIGAPNISRILDSWSTHETRALRWVAIRTHALIGPERPGDTLRLLRRVRRKEVEESLSSDPPKPLDEDVLQELREAVELLLLSPAGDEVLRELLAHLQVDRAAHDLAVEGFLAACRRETARSGAHHHPYDAEYVEGPGRPVLLGWFGEAVADAKTAWAARGLATLWQAALRSRAHTDDALSTLRAWVLAADRSPDAEQALAALLPALVTDPADAQRISHLLRTMPGEDGGGPPPVAGRLLTVVPAGTGAHPALPA
ncbi:hypothetical protein G6W47_29795 [Streptomyces sp. CAI-21]|uniref:hypothetical protein n=1 Tax=Streptomyces TaxID=1883 RepID=UPI000689896E|nr:MULTISPECIES: hypothetical protein [Streptomyces]MBO1285165.1 hypothetical protein [Streptomyces sampsonii]NUW11076.1 hypothetical protein [Streptomyces sp. CAI-21]MEE1724309.1 hypothetical protein [Streptomyces sp. JV186]RZE24691.1 hypothetical protein C0Q96_19285 [Streptomyces albidoflavus]RZE73734.1 hypothetical protein C0Q99_19855 [Streptomyces albidoflavus]